MNFPQIMTDLNKKIYHPVYFLCGEEPYFIDQISDYIEEHVLAEDEKAFNQTILYGHDNDAESIISIAKRYPMMASHQVVIVKEAQDIRKVEDLQSYIENPLKSTVLVICYKYRKIDKRRSLFKAVEKNGIFFESFRLYEDKIPDWIRAYLQQKGFTITPKAAILLTEYLGTDLTRIVNELEKLLINIPAPTQITEDHIEQHIGISKDYNVFELQKALGNKNILKANQIINYFAANEKDNPLVKVVSILYGFFIKVLMYHHLADKSKNAVATALSVNPFFVQDYSNAAQNYSPAKITTVISLLREYDLKSKGVDNVTTPDGGLLKELVYKILH
ncbi:MAG: DNA polymerase III subunit delta [Bacteroidetes bacterium]|nr:DNA polymerase III subunit delta [Bacteroidota bacterium]